MQLDFLRTRMLAEGEDESTLSLSFIKIGKSIGDRGIMSGRWVMTGRVGTVVDAVDICYFQDKEDFLLIRSKVVSIFELIAFNSIKNNFKFNINVS